MFYIYGDIDNEQCEQAVNVVKQELNYQGYEYTYVNFDKTTPTGFKTKVDGYHLPQIHKDEHVIGCLRELEIYLGAENKDLG